MPPGRIPRSQKALKDFEDSGIDVDERDRIAARGGHFLSGLLEQGADAHLGVVERRAVGRVSMLVEGFTVVGSDDDHAVVIQSVQLEVVDEQADLLIHVAQGIVVFVYNRFNAVLVIAEKIKVKVVG